MIFALMWSLILAVISGQPETTAKPVELCSPWPVSPAAVAVAPMIAHEWTCKLPTGCWAQRKDPSSGLWTLGWFRRGDMISAFSKTDRPYGIGWQCCAEQARNRRQPCHWSGG